MTPMLHALHFQPWLITPETHAAMLAVPFALSGGGFLQYLLDYNFNGAVWVGYIALFGTAVQTGVVMVVYLEETVKKRQAELGAAFDYPALVQAVKDGARLRLRPKVMTVATIVARLMPIMWSHLYAHPLMTEASHVFTARVMDFEKSPCAAPHEASERKCEGFPALWCVNKRPGRNHPACNRSLET